MNAPNQRNAGATEVPACDTFDEKLTKVKSPEWSEAQRRFLDAYRQRPSIAPAARLAGVHRATVYRWQVNPDFAAAMQSAADQFFQAHRARVLAEEQAREAWRRERERRPMRCFYLTRARAAKRR